MSNNKYDKDSYARDTMAYSVPENERRKKRPAGQNPQRSSGQGRPHGVQPGVYGPPNEYGQYPNEYGYYPDAYGRYPNQYGQYPDEYGNYPPPPAGAQRNGAASHQGNKGGSSQSRSSQGRPPQNRSTQGRPPQNRSSQGKSSQNRQSQGRPPQSRSGTRSSGQRGNAAGRPAQGTQQKRLQNQRAYTAAAPVKKRHKSIVWRIIRPVVILLLAIFLIYSIIALVFINKMNIVDRGERLPQASGVMSSSGTRNILLIGTDSRSDGERGRSDSMIMLSMCSDTNTINMVSFMRDAYVEIPGHGSSKLNAAYSFGGPELLMDTIEQNFKVEIDDYITVNFNSFADIVDAVGGVEIEVSDEEAAAINVMLDSKEGKKFFGEPKKSDYLDGAGTYEMNGKQALFYSRLRKVGNADFERTERQRKVLNQIIGKVSNPARLMSAAGSALPSMTTNMGKGSLYLLSLKAPFMLAGYDTAEIRIPAENTYSGANVGGQSVLQVDFDANIDILEEELYGK